jgi:hypothetical protein
MYQRAQEEAAASGAGPDGAGSTDGSTNGTGQEEEDVVDAEVVDEGK